MVVPLILYWHGTLEANKVHLRYHGTLLQLLGLGIVAKGLIETCERFEKRGLWRRFKLWVGSLVRRPPPPVIVAGHAASMGHSTSGAYSSYALRADPTIQEQVDELQRLVKGLRDDLTRTHNATSDDIRTLNKRIEYETIERTQDLGATKKRLDDQIAGGLDENYIGWFLVLFGTLLSGLHGRDRQMDPIAMAKRWFDWSFVRIWRVWFVIASATLRLPVIKWIWGYDYAGSNKIHWGLFNFWWSVFS